MKEYFREEWVRIRHNPLLLLFRILFLALLLITGYARWAVMLGASIFAVGLFHSSEAEFMLPLSEEAIMARKRVRLNMVALRFAIFGLLAAAADVFVFRYVSVELLNQNYLLLTQRPLMSAAYFVLQMAVVYVSLLEMMIGGEKLKKLLGRFGNIVFDVIPKLGFFIFSFILLNEPQHMVQTDKELAYAALYVILALLNLTGILIVLKNWKCGDFSPARV
ncbi:MAG: hypothetical protein K6E50_04740 [Lachnospiraceae bacterium]|nr:hypothetical protein [Lachnospiraceae bacterium]